MVSFIREIPCRETFFLLEEIPNNVKVTPDLIELNYKIYSPFKDSDFFYIKKNGKLMLWFYPKKSFLSYPSCIKWLSPYIKRAFSGILIKEEGNIYYVFPVKEGIILGQYIVDKNDLTTLIKSLKIKYNLKDKEFIKFKKISLDFYFLIFPFFFRKLMRTIIRNRKDFLSKALLALIFINLLFLIVGIIKLVILDIELKNIEQEKAYYTNIARKTKESFFLVENRSKEWSKITINFPYLERNISDILKTLKSSSVKKVVSFDAYYLKNQNEFKVYMNIVSNGIPKFLSRLASLRNMKKVRILDSYPKGNSRVYKILLEISCSPDLSD